MLIINIIYIEYKYILCKSKDFFNTTTFVVRHVHSLLLTLNKRKRFPPYFASTPITSVVHPEKQRISQSVRD